MAEKVGRALVLGGGGIAGIAWEAGLIAGLQAAGTDLTTADLFVGTSAGSVVSTFLSQGADLEETIEGIAADSDTAPTQAEEVDMNTVMETFAVLFDPSLDPQEARARVGRIALETRTAANAPARLTEIGRRLPSHEWPDRRLLITAVDAADGAFVIWEKSSGVPLPLAVASSCAVPTVFPPVEIGGRHYMDGGIRATTNADLARGATAVVVFDPLAHLLPRTTLKREIAELGGVPVVAIGPDQATVEVFGVNVMNPALWRPAFRAGQAQAESVAPRVAEVWETSR
ncbi:patatin-like phospholipase family protein [Actinomadura craniellae]|uniref:Patatin-like phospholipase family protein n=1 Tax=Actinomadura craniellae TaxID=2231787 RepID=A0A365H2Z2_9ACTN|nr:patatin-like phospholipase family protein [Actinomadura craniellae]RAY13398.1 patatin-like phospholipase family protein [Actinomadura craniellae]